MKFCYIDESGTGEYDKQPYAIMAGVIVDSSRMGITKDGWAILLDILSKQIKKEVKEFHTKDFYSGNGCWRELNGEARAQIITSILKWLKGRKHRITFCAVEKRKFSEASRENQKLKEIGSVWRLLGLHLILSVQKAHQVQNTKGYTVFIFDEEVKEKDHFIELVWNPPKWTDTFYLKKEEGQQRLHSLIDTPYFGKSEKVHLLQIADLLAYILRRYLEMQDAKMPEKYSGEEIKIKEWIKLIAKLALPSASRYPKKGQCECSKLFFEFAPLSIKEL